MSLRCFPASFGSIRLTVREETSFEEFQDGRYGGLLGYPKGTIFSNSEYLCHSDASHQVSAQSDLWFERCRLKNFKMAVMESSWIAYRNDFSNSKSLRPSDHVDASHQVSAQSDLRFGRS